MRHCPHCGQDKPPTEFYLARKKPDGLQKWCKTCCKDQQKIRRNADKEVTRKKRAEYRTRYRSENPERRWSAVELNRTRSYAHKIDCAFGLTLDLVRSMIVLRCPIFNTPLIYEREGNPASAILERIDHTRGYVVGNVAIMSRRAARVKNGGTIAEHEAVTEWMVNLNRRKLAA